jgi:hypothetical protein
MLFQPRLFASSCQTLGAATRASGGAPLATWQACLACDENERKQDNSNRNH